MSDDLIGPNQIGDPVPTVAVPPKSIFKSKTFWVNMAGIAYDGISLATRLPLPPIATAILGAVNIGLRVWTSSPTYVIKKE